MYAGQIVETGLTAGLYHETAHPYTRLLFAATPDLYGDEDVVSIPGAPPRLDEPIKGCAFLPRCDRVVDRCSTDRPELLPVPGGEAVSGSTGHAAACHVSGGADDR
jgi:oligopeptide/dipeptide ABC transporter ATP-binding protein